MQAGLLEDIYKMLYFYNEAVACSLENRCVPQKTCMVVLERMNDFRTEYRGFFDYRQEKYGEDLLESINKFIRQDCADLYGDYYRRIPKSTFCKRDRQLAAI